MADTVRIATWNVNSIRVRFERLLAFLERHKPDALCLQEIKIEAEKFPHEAINAVGYYAAVHGQKTYNGVAILTPKQPPSEPQNGWAQPLDGDDHARLITAKVHGIQVVNVYIPNGSEPSSPKFAYKLAWLAHLQKELTARFDRKQPLLLCGDFNVAPEDKDVANPAQWKDTVLCHPAARSALEDIRDVGLFDAFRLLHREPGLYSWWDYRGGGFPKNDGLRIDHIWVNAALRDRCKEALIDREERKGQQPSDHAPVIATFTR